MPSLFNGFYLAGEGQAGTYPPLHWLLYRLLPLNPAFAIEIVVAYPCLFLGTFMFLRRWSTAAPAAFGAMLFTFCGFNLTHGVHPNMVGVIAHVPWVLWAIHIAAAGTGLPSRLAGCALVVNATHVVHSGDSGNNWGLPHPPVVSGGPPNESAS